MNAMLLKLLVKFVCCSYAMLIAVMKPCCKWTIEHDDATMLNHADKPCYFLIEIHFMSVVCCCLFWSIAVVIKVMDAVVEPCCLGTAM